MRLIAAAPGTPVIDIGADTSTLVDTLLDAGWVDASLLDVCPAALSRPPAPDSAARCASRIDLLAAVILDWHPTCDAH